MNSEPQRNTAPEARYRGERRGPRARAAAGPAAAVAHLAPPRPPGTPGSPAALRPHASPPRPRARRAAVGRALARTVLIALAGAATGLLTALTFVLLLFAVAYLLQGTWRTGLWLLAAAPAAFASALAAGGCLFRLLRRRRSRPV
ncbi:hypothetical protein F8568_014375 [Actinomadura sp. LD22]|uniref:Uncharacterized protein n=1 Tax=Actinomadura physcomitrii TaxID=2650748 RepID=A0A6I4M6Y5_9ACTN|nr:hypothetical protein [Actinomadura physcomitrii]MWA01543.1 hypothetical protein [Actinomadura physcomitrii]